MGSGYLTVMAVFVIGGAMMLPWGDRPVGALCVGFGTWGIGVWLGVDGASPCSPRLRRLALLFAGLAAVVVGAVLFLWADDLVESSSRLRTPHFARGLGVTFAIVFGAAGTLGAMKYRGTPRE